MQNPRNQWPTQVNAPVTDLEKRALKVHLAKAPSEELLARFSKLEKALRVLAYVYRFIQRCRKQTSPADVHLLATEIAAAERFLISNTQRREFPVEYHCLSEKRPVPSSSAILSMNPFLDPQGLIRACGRVAASESLQYNERHPVILPYNCLLSRLLANFTHRITLHGGNQLMVRLIRSKYWIPRIKNLMKAVVNSCKAVAKPTDGCPAQRKSIVLPPIHVYWHGLRRSVRYKELYGKSMSYYKGVCVSFCLFLHQGHPLRAYI